jgi:hypothetical protein
MLIVRIRGAFESSFSISVSVMSLIFFVYIKPKATMNPIAINKLRLIHLRALQQWLLLLLLPLSGPSVDKGICKKK